VSTRALAAALVVLSTLGPLAAARADDATELARTRAAAERHPDDADLAWAYARALERAGRDDEAIARYRAIASRWPERAADSHFEVGAILYARSDFGGALRAFGDVVALDPTNVPARAYRALALDALGRAEEAERELAVVERLSRELRAEALLLKAVHRFEADDPAGGRQLLREALELEEADSPSAAATPDERRRGYSLFAQLGTELDSNVTLDSGTAFAGVSTDQSEVRMGWGAGFTLDLLRSERAAVWLGYAYGESAHEELKDFDLRTHTAFGSLGFAVTPRVWLRLDGAASDVHVADDRYLRSWQARGNAFASLGESLGLSRLWLSVERSSYHDRPPLPSLDRDGSTYRLGLEHVVGLPRRPGAVATLGGALSRTNTEASRDPLGFQGDYDNRSASLYAHARIPLAGRLELRLGGQLLWERYVNRNLIDALTDEGVGTPFPSRRRDGRAEATAALAWTLRPPVRVELRWTGIRSRSNVDVYDYGRQILGAYFTAETSSR
jgi:tetratricopeptide (TPR) repeat protein